MATATAFNAARMKQIEDTTIVDGEVDPQNHLILTKRNGDQVDAGSIASNAKMVAEDSTSVDITVGGVGSDLDPFRIKGDIKKIPASAVDSGRFDLARIPDQTVRGLLEASYRGGPAKVKVNGVLSSVAYPWMTPYVPGSSREVELLQTGSSWKIMGQSESNVFPMVLNETLWSTYSEYTNNNAFNNRPRATLLPSGIVVLSGLLSSKGTPADGSVIANIPPALAPDFDTRVTVEMADIPKGVYITSTGAIQAWGGFSNNQYLTLDGIAYPSKGTATWTPLGQGGSSVGTKFSINPAWNSIYGVPSFWKDPYGFVWFQGLLQIATSLNAEDPILSLPNNCLPSRGTHYRMNASDTYAAIGYNMGGNSLVIKSGSPSVPGNWYSLAGIAVASADSFTLNPWKTPRSFANSWTNYNPASFTSLQYLLREDGLRITSGLLSGGGVSTNSFTFFEDEYIPRFGRIIIPSMATNARARIDLSPLVERNWSPPYMPGSFIHQQGPSTWYSLDSRMWST